jgi:thiol-disulfide isomerase/thioredoxin
MSAGVRSILGLALTLTLLGCAGDGLPAASSASSGPAIAAAKPGADAAGSHPSTTCPLVSGPHPAAIRGQEPEPIPGAGAPGKGTAPALAAADLAPAQTGWPAVDIAGIDANGAACALSDDKGSVILLDVSAIWCYWCQVDTPAIQSLCNSYQGRGLKVVTVLAEDANGGGPCTQANLKSWTGTYGLSFRVQSDRSGTADGVAEKTYVGNPASMGFPTLVLIDKNFNVQYLKGGLTVSEVQAEIEKLLAQ